MERQFIDISEDKELCENFKLPVHLDPVRNYIQDNTVEFTWIYRAQSSVLYLEELDPEARIRDAYLKSERAAKGTVLFHPYKKLYNSQVLRKFILEDPYDPERATVKYCREKPLNFVIFGKPGLNTDTLGMELAKYWHSVHVSPTVSINKIGPLKLDENMDKRLRKGLGIGINDVMPAVKEMLKSPELKRRGYVITGLPVRHDIGSDYYIHEQLELIFEAGNRPDIIIYTAARSADVLSLNEEGFTQDIDTGYCLNDSHIRDGAGHEKDNRQELDRLGKFAEKNYDYHLMKEYETYYRIEKNGFPVRIGGLPSYNKDLVDDYTQKILPIIDSYILEYDAQCVIKVDGRMPVAKMLDTVKVKLSLLPFLPRCEAKPIFEELIEKETGEIYLDDRSEDSLEEEKPEPDLEEEDDEEVETIAVEGEDDETAEPEEAPAQNEEEAPANSQMENFNKMVPKEALSRLKDFNKIDPDFKWGESDFQSYCPVEHRRGHVCLGIPQYTCSYLGKLYMMSSHEAMKKFIFDPDYFIIPPKPFPTCKIFVTGPPCSGKTTFVKILGKFFNLEVVSIKKLIEEIAGRKFYDMQVHELIRKQKRVSKVENFENEIFEVYERKRGTDIINWIEQQLPYIYQRIKFTSLIEIPTQDQDEMVEEEAGKEENTFLESDTEDDSTVELILPAHDDFLESINQLLKPDLKRIIMLEKYAIELPDKFGYEKIYENPDVDRLAMLMKKQSYEAANVDLKTLKHEFNVRGLNFYLDNEQYVDIFINPIKLLQYLPNRFRRPYYDLTDIDFEDIRIYESHSQDVGIRTGLGYIKVSLEELIDRFETAILDIEAEINLNKLDNDLQIGGWIVDDIPVVNKFWEILIDRYLLPDDIIIRTVGHGSGKSVIESFCDLTRPRDLSFDGKDGRQTVDVVNLEDGKPNDDPEMPNTFLEVKNSFLKINRHYKAEYENFEDQTTPIKKTCSVQEENIVTQEVLNQLSKLGGKKYTDIKKYLYSTKDTTHNTTMMVYRNIIENPFDVKSLDLVPFHLNFWDDDVFLKELYQNITKTQIITTGGVEIVYEAPNADKDNIISLSNMVETSTKLSSQKRYDKRSSLEDEHSHHSISSSSNSTEAIKTEEIPGELTKRYLADKTRTSLTKKKKVKRSPISVYEAFIAARKDIARPESLFQLHNKIILDIPKQKFKVHDIFDIFYREIDSHLSAEPREFELKYLTEIRKLLGEGANLNEIAMAMAKYMRKKKRETESEDNIMLKRPYIDIGTISDTEGNRVRPDPEYTSVISDANLRGDLQRQGSLLNLVQLKSKSSLKIGHHKEQSRSDISRLSLPLICSTSSHSLEEQSENSQIFCYKKSGDDLYKSSSVLLNIESLPSVQSNLKVPLKKSNKKLHLPKIISQTGTVQECSSCYCNDTETREEFCTCSSSTDSDIEVERKKKILCIWDESCTVIPPPSDEIGKKSSSKVESVHETRDEIAMRTIEHNRIESLDKLIKDVAKTFKAAQNVNSITENYEIGEAEEEGNTEETNFKTNIWSENRETGERIHDHHSDTGITSTKFSQDAQLNIAVQRKKSEAEITQYEDECTVREESSVNILYKACQDSTISTVLATSSNELITYHKSFDLDENVPLESVKSGAMFSLYDSSLSLLNGKPHNSDVLLPGVTGVEWERFITFINSLYLSVSTFDEVGFNESSHTSFYLECCPSRSQTNLENYHKKDSISSKKSKNWNKDIKAQALDFVSKASGRKKNSYSKQEGEDVLCVLEIALPMSESRFNIALDTALTCLTLGKTISELFSANKHNDASRQRFMASSLENTKSEYDAIKTIKESESLSDLDRDSVEISIEDPSLDAILGNNKHGKNEVVELFEGNALRYNSLDERFTPSLEMLSDMKRSSDEQSESEDSNGTCPEIFLGTVPRAILYVPYVIPRFEPVMSRIGVKPKHLRRYYALQTMCRLVCTESPEDSDAGEENENKDKNSCLTFKYILKKPHSRDLKSIYIRRDIEVENKEETEEGSEEMDEVELRQFQEIIEPIIDAVHEEMVRAELDIHDRKSTDPNAIIKTPLNTNKLERVGGSTDTQHSKQDKRKHPEPEESDEIEKEIEKKIEFSFPYDIIKLMFQKYDFIKMKLPYDDIDEALQNELNNMKTPKSFRNFLKAMNHNIKAWVNQWNAFNSDMLKDIECNIINLDFVPFNSDLKKYLADGVATLLHNYGPLAERLDSDKEKLIKTINLETSVVNENELENIANLSVDTATVKEDEERDIGDTELRELLPTDYSEFYPYCPVLYDKSKELVPTNNLYVAEYKDKRYQFSSENALGEFIKQPERYAVIRNSKYNRTPIRICVVAPRDFEGIHIGRTIADFFGIPLKLLSTEIKRLYGTTLNLPVGVFDEDQTNIKMFGLDETKNDPREDLLENSEWDHFRNYFNLTSPLMDNELDSLTDSLWKADYSFVFYSFPHGFEDFDYMVRKNIVPDVVIFIDVTNQRAVQQHKIEERIKARQVLNFGARLKRLLAADHLRYKTWMEAYPKQFNIVLRQFLRQRRAERNFKERLKLVLPTFIFPQQVEVGEETTEAEEDVRPWDVDWLLYQVGEQKELKDEVDDAIEIKRLKRYMHVLDSPKISPNEREKFLELVQSQHGRVEVLKPIVETEIIPEEVDVEGEFTEEESTKIPKELTTNLSEIDFPNIKSIFESSYMDMSEEGSVIQENENVNTEAQNDKSDLISSSEEKMNEGIKIVNRRQVAVTDFFNPPFEKKYQPKFTPIIFKSVRPFNIDDYKNNVTEASSTSLLGHDETDSIELRELTSSLTLLDTESTNKQTRLLQLIFGNKIAPKEYFTDIIKQFKDAYPAPVTNVRKLQKISIKNSKEKLKEYYKNEKEHIEKMKSLCKNQNIPYINHNSTSPIKNLIQAIQNLVRKPNSFENIFILNNKTATKLLENGLYFLSRFGHWCPVQIYEHRYPMQQHYIASAEEKIIVPIIHKRYIYFINGRDSAVKFAQNPLQYTEQDTMLSIFPMKIAIIGQHKSNKTLLAKNLARLHCLDYITVELAINYVLEKLHWSCLAKMMIDNLKKGLVLTNTEIIESIESFINGSSKALTNGWILDGYPISSNDLEPMRRFSIIPNVIFSVEPSEEHVQDMFWGLKNNKAQIQENIYKGNEFIDMDYDEEEDEYYKTGNTNVDSSHDNFENNTEIENENTQPDDEKIDNNVTDDWMQSEEGEEIMEHYMKSKPYEEPPEHEYIKRIKEMMSVKESISTDIVRHRDFDDKMIDFELKHMLPPACTVEMRMLVWLKRVKKYDKILKEAGETWGNIYKLEWKEDDTKLMEVLDDVLMAYLWALQDYNLNIAKGKPASLYLIGVTKNEYQLHKSPFNDCCPVCWYYYRIYFRCPTCLFTDMKPGLIQYENFFYWLCLQHYDMFMSNPIKFLMSYETAFRKQYPEKASVGELFIKDNLNIQYNGLCITCYYNHLPNLLHIKGYGKYSVIINTKDIYLFCSDRCACEMLMRPERYLNLEIEYMDVNSLPQILKLTRRLPCKGFLDKLVNDAIYDGVCKFIYLRPKIFKLSLQTSACTYLAVNLKLKAKYISKRERNYYKKLLLYLEDHCKEVEMFCRNIDQVFAFMGPLSIIEQAKAKCLPRRAQDNLLKDLLPPTLHHKK